MVDGARLVTPGVVANILRAQQADPHCVVSVPGYHLGDQLHQDAVLAGYSADQEQEMLSKLGWRQDGYRLFDRAVLSASCGNGYLRPIGESNCIALPRKLFHDLAGFDEGFVTLGGGFVNLDFYRRCVDVRADALYLTPGEGTFHQFHGVATTGAEGVDRDELLASMAAEYAALRGTVHAPPVATPILIGSMNPKAIPFLRFSCDQSLPESVA